jgi:Putative transmembrane protein (PGPGW)
MTADPRDERERRRFSFKDEVWGDEPEEVDAAEVVQEIQATEPELAQRWYDHPAVAPFTMVVRFIRRSGKRIAVTIAGFLVIIAGAALLVLPGPGLLVIIAGLAILATEYVWAQRLLKLAKEKANQAKDAVLGRKGDKPQGPTDS